MSQLNDDELIQKLLNTRNESEYFKTKNRELAKFPLLATKEEHLAQKEGRLTIEDVTIPGYGRSHLLKEQFQGIVGPNHLWYFTVNVGKVMQNCKFTGADLAVWNRILQNMWYYNYICIHQGQYARALHLTEKTISETFKKFRENFIIESVAPEQKIPQEVSGYKGIWFRVSTDMVWLGPVWALEKPPRKLHNYQEEKEPRAENIVGKFHRNAAKKPITNFIVSKVRVNMKIELVHEEMVTRLKKPGEVILAEMTPEKADMLHMAGCICEEAGELFSAIKRHVFYNKPLDTANVIEELGDLEFYIEGLRQRLQLRRKQTLLANVVKLDGNRYKLGVYSDEDAQVRADKANEVERGSGHEW